MEKKINVELKGDATITGSELEAMYLLIPKYTRESNIEGMLTVPKGYLFNADGLLERFPSLTINITQLYYVFLDKDVGKILINSFGDGCGLTELELVRISDIGELFKNSTALSGKDFIQLNLLELKDEAFSNSFFEYVEFPRSLSYLGTNVFKNCNPDLIVMLNSRVAAKQHLDFTLGSEPKCIYVQDVDWEWFINESNLKLYKHIIDPKSDIEQTWLEFADGSKMRYATEQTILI